LYPAFHIVKNTGNKSMELSEKNPKTKLDEKNKSSMFGTMFNQKLLNNVKIHTVNKSLS